MVGCCLFLPSTPPANAGGDAIQQAFGMLKQPNFLLFIVTSLCVAGTMQFYFLGSGQYMMDRGISGKAVPGAMAMAQAAAGSRDVVCLGLGSGTSRIPVDAGDRVGQLDAAVCDLRGDCTTADPGCFPGLARLGLRHVHDRDAEILQRRCLERDRGIHARTDLRRHERCRCLPRHTTGRICHGQVRGQRQVPVAEDLGRPAGRSRWPAL